MLEVTLFSALGLVLSSWPHWFGHQYVVLVGSGQMTSGMYNADLHESDQITEVHGKDPGKEAK